MMDKKVHGGIEAGRPGVNIAEAKKRFSDLIGRVAYRGDRVLILRRGKPMAEIGPAPAAGSGHLADVRGWLDDDDPLFDAIDRIVASRGRRVPRVLSPGRRSR